MSANSKTVFWVFIGIWLAINLLQAIFTGLLHDEAYYFFYSRHLAWGYYDHPPLTALLIKAGTLAFPGAIGVRVLFVMISAGTILILYKLSGTVNSLLFAILAFSFLFLQITGFLALPDSILVFFSALFFLAYKRFCVNYGIKDGIILGLVMAGMFYGKYLGILVVFFTVMSNLNLLKKPSFWLAVLTTTLIFLPHLYWQYQHDFPTFYYHLTERSHDEIFRWANFADFIIGQIGQVNPFFFFPVIYFLILFKPSDSLDRAMKFTAAGSLLLPFLLMIKGRVEANWTMAGLIPLFLIAFRMIEDRPKMHRFVFISGWITIVLVMLIRIFLISGYVPEKYKRLIQPEISGWKDFSEKVSRIAGDRPVVFLGTYQVPSQYGFYSGKEAHSFNNSIYRNNQYDLENIEERLDGREVVMFFPPKSISPAELKTCNLEINDSIENPNGKYLYYIAAENFHAYNRLPVEIDIREKSLEPGSVAEIDVILKNPGTESIKFSEVAGKVYLTYTLLHYGKTVYYWKFKDISLVELKDEYRTSFKLKMPLKPGTYYLRVSVKSSWLPPGINSRLVKVKVK